MATIGKASLLIVPRFDNLSKTVDEALRKAGAGASKAGEGLGERTSSGFGRGLLASGASIGAFSTLTSAAMSSISSHVGDAVSRFDTLNQYPRTMELLGYSTESAESSIAKMSDRLSTLPTRLDDMAGTVQGIVAITGDLDQATDAGLALNDMLVASGSSTQLTTAAMEQFRQMLAKGKPEMEDWKSLTSAMPGQMSQLAKAMLGPTATANDLYAALGGGKTDPTLTMDDLLEAMIRLDNEGGEGITSFREQAETAAGGVQTAISNMGNAVTKGITGIMDEIGRDNISGVLGDIKGGINDAFGLARDVMGEVVPIAEDLYGALEPLAPVIAAGGAGFAAWRAGTDILGSVSSKASGLSKTLRAADDALALAAGGAGTLSESLDAVGLSINPVSLAVAGLSVAVGAGIALWADYTERQENFTAATRGLTEAAGDTAALGAYSETISGIAEGADRSAMSVDELAESTAAHVDAMRENNAAAEEQIAELSTAQSIINECAGATDLSAGAQGRLEWALKLVNDQLGLNITQSDVAAGSYKDQDGNVQNLTESINSLIEAKKNEARQTAITSNLTEAYQAQTDAAATLAAAQKNYSEAMEVARRERGDLTDEQWAAVEAQIAETSGLNDATEQYDSAASAVASLEDQLGTAAAATSEAADAFDLWAASTSPLFQEQLKICGTTVGGLAEDLRSLGADTTALGALSDDQLEELAYAYDGTTASIVGKLDEWGVGMDEAAAGSARNAAAIRGELSKLSDSGGMDLASLSQKLADAGVSSDDLRRIGTANLDALAAQCGYDMGAMVTAIQGYNDKDLESKHSDATVGGNAVDGSARTGVEGASGAIRGLPDRSVSVNVYGNYERASSVISGLAGAIGSIPGQVTSYVNQVVRQINSAEGGIVYHASGGVAYHADGFIANRPGAGVSLDHRVGEAGAEAIVPLTNRRYSQPFVDLIAEGVAERSRGERPAVINNYYTFNQPIESPYEVARAVRLAERRGLAAEV